MDFVHRQLVRRPPDEVFAFIAEFENNPRWQSGMVACRWTSDARLEVGSTYDQEARFFGRPILTSFVVTAYEPGRSISIESTESTFPIQVTRTVEPADDGCIVTAHVRGQPTGLLALLSFMVPLSVRRDYRALSRLLEAPADGA